MKGGVQQKFSLIASFLGAHFYQDVLGGYLNRIGTVKYSHNWPAKGSQPGNPGNSVKRK